MSEISSVSSVVPDLYTVAASQAQSSVPIIDLERIDDEGVVQAFGRTGFVAVKAHHLVGIALRVYREGGDYWKEPEAEKRRDIGTPSYKGYIPFKAEGTGDHIDHREGYRFHAGEPVLPTHHPDFAQAIQDYHDACHDLALDLLGRIFKGAGASDEDVVCWKEESSSNSWVGCWHHPAGDAGAIGSYPHIDKMGLTILAPQTAEGLYVHPREEGYDWRKLPTSAPVSVDAPGWTQVIVPQGHVIVNIGYDVQLKLAGMIEAPLHMVRNPGVDRQSCIFFFDPPDDSPIDPFPECVDKMRSLKGDRWVEALPTGTTKDSTNATLIMHGHIPLEGDIAADLRRKNLID